MKAKSFTKVIIREKGKIIETLVESTDMGIGEGKEELAKFRTVPQRIKQAVIKEKRNGSS